MKKIQAPRRSVPHALIKKCGGSALPAVTTGKHLLTADFPEAAVLFVPGNVTAPFFELAGHWGQLFLKPFLHSLEQFHQTRYEETVADAGSESLDN